MFYIAIYRFVSFFLFYVLAPIFLLCRQYIGKKPAGNIIEKLALEIPSNIRKIKPKTKTIWIHAVSFGEIKTIEAFISELKTKYPEHLICLSTTTNTGYQLAKDTYTKDDQIQFFYYPFDFYSCVKAYLERINPEFIILTEGDIWPELLFQAKSHSIPIYLINGRITDSSIKSYKYPFIKGLMKTALSAVHRVYAQSTKSAQHFITLGISETKIEVIPNLKFSNMKTSPENTINSLKRTFDIKNTTKVIIAGSTHRGEDRLALGLYANLLREEAFSDIRLIIVPRHLERVRDIEHLAEKMGLKAIKRSKNKEFHCREILVVDTMGELMDFYGLADIALLGGTWVSVGGHNPLEPLAYGVPVITGPYIFKIEELAAQLKEYYYLYTEDKARKLLNRSMNLLSMGKVDATALKEKTGIAKYLVDDIARY